MWAIRARKGPVSLKNVVITLPKNRERSHFLWRGPNDVYCFQRCINSITGKKKISF